MKKTTLILLLFPILLISQNNYSLNFDGNDNIQIPGYQVTAGDGMSFSFWAQSNFSTNEAYILDFNNDSSGWRYIIYDAGSEFVFRVENESGGNQITANQVLNNTNWQYITASVSSTGEMSLFVNNTQQTITTNFISPPFTIDGNQNYIGGSWDTGDPSDYFTGNLDNLTIWNTALTFEDHLNYMNCPVDIPITAQGIAGYWQFEEGSGTTALDVEGQDLYHGEINGAIYDGNVPEQNCSANTETCDFQYYKLTLLDETACNNTELNICTQITQFSFEDETGSVIPTTIITNETTNYTEQEPFCNNGILGEGNVFEGDYLVFDLTGEYKITNIGIHTNHWNNQESLWEVEVSNNNMDWFFYDQFNYGSNGTCGWTNYSIDGQCVDVVLGCTEITACNYNPNATEDDGSCEDIPQVTISGETETCEENILLEAIGGPYDSYQWYLDGDVINNENQTTLLAEQSGVYKIEAENGVVNNNFSLLFDGQNDYIEISDNETFDFNQNDISVSCWVKLNNTTGNYAIIDHITDQNNVTTDARWNFRIQEGRLKISLEDNANCVGCQNEFGAETTNAVILDNQWHHVAYTFDYPETIKFYLDGVEQTNITIIVNTPLDNTLNPGGPIYIGRHGDDSNSTYFDGNIDQLHLWEKELSAGEVVAYMDCPPIGDEGGLLAYWPLEEDGIALIYDQANNIYNGGFINMSTNEAWDTDSAPQNCPINCLTSAETIVTINNCGCTDSTADNFDSTANVDDGGCEYWGCTDSTADNFDPTANVDDGGCEYLGCTDSTADNFDPTANVDDGGCEYLGCTDSTADNFDSIANVDDGSCEYWGCTDSSADNFDSTANVDNGSCEYWGCTDSSANNFDSTANVDDGSCEYLGCIDPGACNYNVTANTDDGSCEYDTCAGCTDPSANNYNPEATVDNGNCEYLGCTDSTADNFDSTANVDDGSCEYWGCTDSSANNFDSTANVDDGTCEYWGCVDPSACNFDPNANTDDGTCQLCASREFNDGSYLDVDSEIINAQGITISFWVNDNDFCANPEDFATYIDFGSQDSYRFVVRNRSCKIEAFFEGDMLPTEFDWGTMDWGYPKASAAGGIGPQSGWRQITAVFCPTTITIYVSTQDGTNLVASNGTGVFFDQGFNLFAEDIKRIGSNQVDYEPANAMIDEVRIWGRALTQNEVEERAGLMTELNTIEEINNLNGYWKMDCDNPFLNQMTDVLGVDNGSLVNENFNGNGCDLNSDYEQACPPDQDGFVDCNACDPPAGCTDDGLQDWSIISGTPACNYDYLAVEQTPNSCFYIWDYCPSLEYPEYYDCDCKCINDSDSDDVCDELEVEGCSEDESACNYDPEGTEPCVYPEDEFGIDYVDCDGNCLNDMDGDGACDEYDNCIDIFNPNQDDLNGDGIGDDCDGVGLEEGLTTKKLIKVTDVLGREIQKETKGSTLMYWYNTGEVDIKYIF